MNDWEQRRTMRRRRGRWQAVVRTFHERSRRRVILHRLLSNQLSRRWIYDGQPNACPFSSFTRRLTIHQASFLFSWLRVALKMNFGVKIVYEAVAIGFRRHPRSGSMPNTRAHTFRLALARLTFTPLVLGLVRNITRFEYLLRMWLTLVIMIRSDLPVDSQRLFDLYEDSEFFP
ncbi:hypothetical protein SCHPADRAFT_459444 [Schizopora paradoxa]|uniref:Uncharacterized protein n=1 Tax=Schizopora paradoxa TaxID=27342 RepID=A0A0H2RJ72_9AGAM|nr:hypothetical protein SCHPADRAFT_459444 [Schizopora paradoxa]